MTSSNSELRAAGQSSRRPAALAAALMLAGLCTGCVAREAGSGNFDRTLTVSGPTRLELTNGAGTAHITVGPPGEVRVHGDFVVRAFPWQSGGRRVADLARNPPIQQSLNVIRVGFAGPRNLQLLVNYTIVAPTDTELRATTGSGDVDVRGINGPVTLTSGSGKITAEKIGSDVRVTVGSGDVRLSGIQGNAEITAGSGDAEVVQVSGQTWATAGSGDMVINRCAGPITAKTGSGDVRISAAAADFRVHTGSGDVTVDGTPAASSYWEVRTGSGQVSFSVPRSANFHFHAHTHLGEIRTALPVVVEERSKRELRAQFGQGGAHVEVETSSGAIEVH